MGFDFLTDLSNMQVEIPPEVSRLAGFFVLLQGGMIYLQKKNNPMKDIWEDLSWVLLGVFQLITLPVEFNASHRALATIKNQGILFGAEYTGAKKTLTAAAMTYVASLAVALLQLLRLIASSRRD